MKLQNKVTARRHDSRATRLAEHDEIAIVAAGISAGQGKAGVEVGPAALLGLGLLEDLAGRSADVNIHHDYTIHTYRELDEFNLLDEAQESSDSSSASSYDSDESLFGNGKMRSPAAVSHATQVLSQQVYWHAVKGRTVLTLGGDHSIGIGTVAGTVQACRERYGKDPVVVWVDAHADINTPASSNSGNIHGMPLAFLTGLARTVHGGPFDWLRDVASESRDKPVLSTKNLVYIGLRDVEPEEQRLLEKHKIKSFSNKDIFSRGVDDIMAEVMAYIGDDAPIHLSYDIDSLDPEFAPSTGTPVRDGLSLDQGKYICQTLYQSSRMVSMDMVEVNPLLAWDEDGDNSCRTVQSAMSIVQSAFGVVV